MGLLIHDLIRLVENQVISCTGILGLLMMLSPHWLDWNNPLASCAQGLQPVARVRDFPAEYMCLLLSSIELGLPVTAAVIVMNRNETPVASVDRTFESLTGCPRLP